MRIRCFTIFRTHKYSIHFLYYTFIEFITLLYTFLVISVARYKENMFCLILFNKFLDVLRAFACVRAIDNLRSICLGANIFKHSLYFVLYLASCTIEKFTLNNSRVSFLDSESNLILSNALCCSFTFSFALLNVSFDIWFRFDLNITYNFFVFSSFIEPDCIFLKNFDTIH